MMPKFSKPPATQRSFGSAWGELDYLCKKIHYWLYQGKRKVNAAHYLSRLEGILHDVPPNELAILRQEGLALLHELKGEVEKAIVHRRREIELMERLHKEAQTHRMAVRAYMLQGRGSDVLAERRTILKLLKQACPQSNGGSSTACTTRRRRPA
jgi:hypothetical protein